MFCTQSRESSPCATKSHFASPRAASYGGAPVLQGAACEEPSEIQIQTCSRQKSRTISECRGCRHVIIHVHTSPFTFTPHQPNHRVATRWFGDHAIRQERAVAHLAFPVTETRCMQAYGWKCTKTSSNNHFSFREHSGGHEALFAAPTGRAVALCSEPRNHIAQHRLHRPVCRWRRSMRPPERWPTAHRLQQEMRRRMCRRRQGKERLWSKKPSSAPPVQSADIQPGTLGEAS